MTDEAKALVELTDKLSDEADLCLNDGADDIAALLLAARLRIETQAREIERLRGALEESLALNINYHAVEEQDGYQFTEAPAVIEAARAALGEKQ